MAGDIEWMAPEVIETTTYSEKADVYSFGIVLYEIYARETPYKGSFFYDSSVGMDLDKVC